MIQAPLFPTRATGSVVGFGANRKGKFVGKKKGGGLR